jgi:hypothetical protein
VANLSGKGGFQPGQSGNPGGRKRGLVHLQAEARRYTAEALRVLLRLMREARSESVRMNAAEIILSRGWGKAVQALQVDARFAEKKLTELTPEEIGELEQRLDPQYNMLGLGPAETDSGTSDSGSLN